MENILDEITFTNYNVSKFILHTNEGKHYIVSKEKKTEIEKILKSEDAELKKKVIEKIKNLQSTQKSNLMFLSDFQYKKTIISGNSMMNISRKFTFLFDKYVLFFATLSIFIVSLNYYFINTPFVKTDIIPVSFSWVLVFLVFIFHEIGHAAACTKYKVKAGEIGFGITSLFPVLYANVTEAWRLERKERMIVNFGGIYFQNLFSLVLLFFGLYTKHLELFFIGKAICISTVYQLFPYYKSDGYWILSDLISEPNLYKISRNIFYNKLKNPKYKLSRKKYLILFYYSLMSAAITYLIVIMGIRYFYTLINLPNYLFNFISNLITGKYESLHLEATYLWAVLYAIFTTKMIINNIKTFILSNGADKVE